MRWAGTRAQLNDFIDGPPGEKSSWDLLFNWWDPEFVFHLVTPLKRRLWRLTCRQGLGVLSPALSRFESIGCPPLLLRTSLSAVGRPRCMWHAHGLSCCAGYVRIVKV